MPSESPEARRHALAELESRAGAIKRCSLAIKPLDQAPVLALFQPLSEHAARIALHLAAGAGADTGEELPALAADLLAQLPAERRARLSLYAVQAWIDANGEPKQRWMLRLLHDSADDRIVEPLATAMIAWGKKPAYPRALVAIAQLAALDTPYALLRVLEAADSPGLKGPLVRAAIALLDAAALRRACGVDTLVDELTPDFGLADGSVSDILGYRLELGDGLRLCLVDAKGKRHQSLPPNKAADMQEEWSAAASHVATLGAALKTSARLQVPRLRSAFISGKSWDAPRWKRLFLEHPLLRIISRSLVWQADAGASFRIAEDFSLIRADHEAFHLAPGARVSLWHPACAQPADAGAWRAHLADYQLAPPIDQTGAPADLPPPALLGATCLLAPEGVRLAQEQLSELLHQAGYRDGPYGDAPGAWIEWHAWALPAARLEVRIRHDGPTPSFHPASAVTLASVTLCDAARDHAPIAPANWPKPLLATIWSHLLLLDARRLA
jgi:hypothetical protein